MSFGESVYVNQTATNLDGSFAQPCFEEVITKSINKKLIIILCTLPVVILSIVIFLCIFIARRNITSYITREKFMYKVRNLKIEDKNKNAGDKKVYSSMEVVIHSLIPDRNINEQMFNFSCDELIYQCNAFLAAIRKAPILVLHVVYTELENFLLESKLENMNPYDKLKLFIVIYKHCMLKGFMTYKMEEILKQLATDLKAHDQNDNSLQILFESIKHKPIGDINFSQFTKINLNEEFNFEDVIAAIKNVDTIEIRSREDRVESHFEPETFRGHIEEKLFLKDYNANSVNDQLKLSVCDKETITLEEICEMSAILSAKQKEINSMIFEITKQLNVDIHDLVTSYDVGSFNKGNKYYYEFTQILYWANYCYYLRSTYIREMVSLPLEDQLFILSLSGLEPKNFSNRCLCEMAASIEELIRYGRGKVMYEKLNPKLEGMFSTTANDPEISCFSLEHQIMILYYAKNTPSSTIGDQSRERLKKIFKENVIKSRAGGVYLNLEILSNIAIQYERDPEKVLQFYESELRPNLPDNNTNTTEFLNFEPRLTQENTITQKD